MERMLVLILLFLASCLAEYFLTRRRLLLGMILPLLSTLAAWLFDPALAVLAIAQLLVFVVVRMSRNRRQTEDDAATDSPADTAKEDEPAQQA